jgi:hypothetical protein
MAVIEMRHRNRGLSIDASYQVLVQLAKRFRGEESKKSANQKQESPVVAMFVNGSGKIFSSEITWPNDRNLVGSIYGRFSVKIANFVPIR